jgi:hypothetical protein
MEKLVSRAVGCHNLGRGSDPLDAVMIVGARSRFGQHRSGEE